jgi:tetratricopeptide (TPR) repeat protein
MRVVLIILFFFLGIKIPAQEEQVEPLFKALKVAKHDTVKLGLRCRIGILEPILRLPYWDSILYEANKKGYKYYEALALNGLGTVYDEIDEGDTTRSFAAFNKAMKIFEDIGDRKEVAHSLHVIGYIYYDRGDVPISLVYYKKSLKIRQKIDFKAGIGESLNNIGFIYQSLGDISQALDYYHKAIKIFEEIGDKKNEAYLLNNIAFLYQGQGDTIKVLENYYKSLKISKEIDDKPGISGIYNNLSVIYQNRKDVTNALKYAMQSLSIRKEIGDKRGIAACLNNIGAAYEIRDDQNSGNYNEPLDYYMQAFEIRKMINDKSAIARSYSSIGLIYYKQKNYTKALAYAENGFKISKDLGFPGNISSTAKLLFKIYKQQNNVAKALEMHELFIFMKDSVNNEETRKSSVRKQFQYEYDKKVTADSVRTIEEKKTVALQLKQEKTQRYALYGGLMLVLIFAGFMFNRFKITQKQKIVIEQQKNIVEEKQKEIVDSITYAKRLQEAILPAEIFWSQNFKNGFFYYQPKDIVAGDFYWLEKIGDTVMFAVADCTGHGVPGALVSVVCSNALNRSVLEFGINDPGKILDKTRELVISTFEKSGEEVKDGMDISLCCLNTKTKELRWAGANNPIWYVSSDDMNIHEIKGDKQPIGKYAIQRPFTSHKVQLNKGDTIYLFTDGLADQFGGPKGKKFKYKMLKEILLANISRSMDDQKEVLEKAFNAWKGQLEQVDDVCVIGVRL